jgi:uncharacterized protein (DUF697 family)
VGLIPFGDQAALPSVLVVMVRALAELFGLTLSREDSTRILKSLASQTVGTFTANHLLGLVPGFGALVNSSVSFGTIEALGWRIYEYFEKQIQPNDKRREESASHRSRAFVCYSHADKTYVEPFFRHLESIQESVDFFVDTTIQPGTLWTKEIEKALYQAKVAVLFISPDFLNSGFIKKYELPSLLDAAKKESALIFPVLVSPVVKTEIVHGLLEYQSPTLTVKPLVDMKKAQREHIFVQIAEAVLDALGHKLPNHDINGSRSTEPPNTTRSKVS